jgi:hypothetical protein
MGTATPEFALAWNAAGRQLEIAAQGPIQSWLKANLYPPFLERLSFRLGNQLFFIRLHDPGGRLEALRKA